MPVACSINSRWRCGCSSGAADTVPGDSSANGSSRDDSGAREAVCRDSDGATTGSGSGTGVDDGRCVGGRSCGAGPSSDDGAAGLAPAPAPGAASGAQGGAGDVESCPFNSGSGVPAFPEPGACAPAQLATGVFTVSASPEHCSDRGARPSADWGAALPVAALASSRPAGCAATTARRALSADGSSENRLWRQEFWAPALVVCGATGRRRRLVDGDRAVRRKCSHMATQRPPAPLLLTRFVRRCRQPKLPGSADVPAPGTTLALGPLGPLGTGKGGFQLPRRGHTQLAALQAGPHPPVAPAQPHRLDAPLRGGVGEAQLPHGVVEQASRTRAAAPGRADRSRRDGPGCALRGSADWRPDAWSARGAADRPAR